MTSRTSGATGAFAFILRCEVRLSIEELLRLEGLLSPERIGPYRLVTADRIDDAMNLYRWNANAAALTFVCLGNLEVLLRNALSGRLSEMTPAGTPWYVHYRSVLTEKAVGDLDRALDRLTEKRKTVTDGRVVAELNLSFWRFLLTPRYSRTLWTPGLSKALPHAGLTLSTISQQVAKVYDLRNRIAHHEPIHLLDLAGRHKLTHEIMGWIDPLAADWGHQHCLAGGVIAKKPSVNGPS